MAISVQSKNPKGAGAASTKVGLAAHGHTAAGKAGAEVEKEFVFPALDGYEGPTASVSVTLGARIGLPNYSDARCSATLTLPCKSEPKEIELAFGFAKKWCEGKMEKMTKEITGA